MADELQVLFERVRQHLDAGDVDAAAGLASGYSAHEIADLFRSLNTDDRLAILRRLPATTAAAILAEVDDRSVHDVMELLQDEEVVGLLDELPSDDAADLVGYVDDDRTTRVLEMLGQVDRQDAAEVTELLRYPEDSAGGLMAKEYLAVSRDRTVAEAVDMVRRLAEPELSSLHFAFVVDEASRLVGRVPLLKLLLSPPQAKLVDVMDADPVSVPVLADQEDVAHVMLRNDLMSLPVVDDTGRLVGRITFDDAMDVLTEEATEDAARLAGSSAVEVGETSVLRISRARLPWLLLGLTGQLLGAGVLSRFEESLQTKVILAFFIPMVMATGGNTGIQTSTIVIRGLVTQEFDTFRAWRHLLREFFVNLLIGVLLGALMALALYLWKKDAAVGLVIGLSIVSVVLMAAALGTTIPLVLHRLRIDPTVATGPFITTLNDILGLTVYFALAHWLLSAF